MKPVKSSYRDPGKGVFTDGTGHRIFRRLPYEGHIYNSFSLFPRVLEKVEGDMHEVECIRFVNHFHEWTFAQCRDSALFYLDRLKTLLDRGWTFTDAQPTNITYEGKGRFTFLDHGSLTRDDGGGWQAHLQFIRRYAYPLMLLANLPVTAPQSLMPFLNDDSWQTRYRPPLAKRFSLGYQVLRAALLLSSRGSLKNDRLQGQGRRLDLRYNIAFLRDFILSMGVDSPKSKWGDYYERTILQDGYLERKLALTIQYVSTVSDRVETAADFGASSGKITVELADRFRNTLFIAIESDPTASEALYRASRSHAIIPIQSNLLQLTPAFGFDGSHPSLDDRLGAASGLNIALGIVHHLMHADNLPFERIIRYFKDRSLPGAFLIIEHIGPGDPMYGLIRNPNYPHAEGQSSFEEALSAHYRIIQKEAVHEHRAIYLAQAK
jgi:hypothetical protein